MSQNLIPPDGEGWRFAYGKIGPERGSPFRLVAKPREVSRELADKLVGYAATVIGSSVSSNYKGGSALLRPYEGAVMKVRYSGFQVPGRSSFFQHNVLLLSEKTFGDVDGMMTKVPDAFTDDTTFESYIPDSDPLEIRPYKIDPEKELRIIANFQRIFARNQGTFARLISYLGSTPVQVSEPFQDESKATELIDYLLLLTPLWYRISRTRGSNIPKYKPKVDIYTSKLLCFQFPIFSAERMSFNPTIETQTIVTREVEEPIPLNKVQKITNRILGKSDPTMRRTYNTETTTEKPIPEPSLIGMQCERLLLDTPPENYQTLLRDEPKKFIEEIKKR